VHLGADGEGHERDGRNPHQPLAMAPPLLEAGDEPERRHPPDVHHAQRQQRQRQAGATADAVHRVPSARTRVGAEPAQ